MMYESSKLKPNWKQILRVPCVIWNQINYKLEFDIFIAIWNWKKNLVLGTYFSIDAADGGDEEG